jgi:hypothetical protein
MAPGAQKIKVFEKIAILYYILAVLEVSGRGGRPVNSISQP